MLWDSYDVSLGCAEMSMEYATRHEGQSMSPSDMRDENQKYHDEGTYTYYWGANVLIVACAILQAP